MKANFVNGDFEDKELDLLDAGPRRDHFSTDAKIKAAWYDYLYVFYCTVLYLADVITDLVVSVKYFRNGDYVWFSLTLICVFGASIVMMVFSLKWFHEDTDKEVSTKKTVALHVLQLGPLERYWDVFWNGKRSRQANTDPIYYNMYIEQWRDITMLRLFETFIESAPQLVLQLYILAYNREFDKDKDWLTALAACISLISLSSSLVSYSKALRDASVNKEKMSWWAFGCKLCWRLAMVASRIIALVLFASVYKSWILLVIGAHWVGMTAWLIYQKTSFCLNETLAQNDDMDDLSQNIDNQNNRNPTLERLFCIVVGFIYIFCFFNSKEGTTNRRLIFFYTVIFIEDVVLMGLWYPYRSEYGVVFVAAMIMVFGGFFLGIIAMLLYYHCYHPNLKEQGICVRIRRRCLDCQNPADDGNELPVPRDLHVDIPISRGSVGMSLSNDHIISPTFEKELFVHQPSELQRRHSLESHKRKMEKAEKAQRLHKFENGVGNADHIEEGLGTSQENNGAKHDGSKVIAIDICGMKEFPEITEDPTRGKQTNTCDDELHRGMDVVERTVARLSMNKSCDNGGHCGMDEEEETGLSILKSKKESYGLYCGVDHSKKKTGSSQSKKRRHCDDEVHCGTDDEEETGPSVSRRKISGLHSGMDNLNKGELKSKLCEIKTPKCSLNVDFQHRYSIVSDCISLPSSSSESDEEVKEITSSRNAQCTDEPCKDSRFTKDDNGNYEIISDECQDNAQSSLHSGSLQRNKQANRVSFPNFVATSLKRGKFSSLRASSEDFAAEMKSKRHPVDLSEFMSHRHEKDYSKTTEKFIPTKYGSVREHMDELQGSSEEK